MISAEKNSH